MVAATKNKRGRPVDKRYQTALEISIESKDYNPTVSTRTIQNSVNAELFECLMIERDCSLEMHQFFYTREGNTKNKGIAEQIGRMMREGLISDDQALRLAQMCIDAYSKGRSSKELEKGLREYRLGKRPKVIFNFWFGHAPGDKSCNL